MTVLTLVMIAGLVTIVGLLVIRLMQPTALPLPENITLPEGTKASAVTLGPGWYGIVTQDNQFLIFDADDGALRQTVTINE